MEAYYPQFSERFQEMLRGLKGRKVAVVGHARPDGDCIGSQVGMSRLLASQGIENVCVNGDAVPERLHFLVPDMKFLRTDDILPIADQFTAVFVDCADGARCGDRLQVIFPRPYAMVDHHISNQGYAEHDFVEPNSASTTEILAGVCLDLDIPIDAVAAQALYTGILTDTGQFKFPATTRNTFLLAAELFRCGAKPSEAGYELYERESLGKIQLLQMFLASFQMEYANRICLGVVTWQMFKTTNTSTEDTEGLVDYTRSIDGVDIGVLIEEREDGSLKASLRAKDPIYRMDKVAALFNGGGHACAAGLNLKQDTENFRARLVAALIAQIEAVESKTNS